MQVLPATRQEENSKRITYLKELRNRNGEDLVNLYVSIDFKKQLIFAAYNSKLIRTLFPVESTDNITIKGTLMQI